MSHRWAMIAVMDDAQEHNDRSQTRTAQQADKTIVLRPVVCHGVRGILAKRQGRWGLDNEHEVRTLLALGGRDYTRRWLGTLASEENADHWLHAIGGIEYVVDWFQALADTLQAGLIGKGQVSQLNKLLKRLANARSADGVAIPAEMLPAVAYACACLGRWKAAQWLEYMLLSRRHIMKRMPEEFWECLIDRADPLLRLVALAVYPRTDPETLARLAHSSVPDVRTRARSHPNAPQAPPDAHRVSAS